MRVALVHDYLTQYGGAERVLEEFAIMFPNAPIFTLIYNPKTTGYVFEGRDIRTSFLQKIPKASSFYRLFPLLMPMAVEKFDFSQFDIVLSSSASFAKGIITGSNTLHACYCHSPMRYAWLDYKKITGNSTYPAMISRFIPFLLPYIRLWDSQSSHRVDAYMCNSKFIRKKIKKYYQRDATIIYPPLNFDHFYISKPKDYFLLVGRMVPYKRFDIAIDAFNDLNLPLKIVGTGPEFNNLKKRAKKNIEFLGLVSEESLSKYYSEARALIFPQEEDFGITALESMACGRPVIAYGAGGALESITEGASGLFFEEQNPESLKAAVMKFQSKNFDPQKIRESVAKFDRLNFHESVYSFLEDRFSLQVKRQKTFI